MEPLTQKPLPAITVRLFARSFVLGKGVGCEEVYGPKQKEISDEIAAAGLNPAEAVYCLNYHADQRVFVLIASTVP